MSESKKDKQPEAEKTIAYTTNPHGFNPFQDFFKQDSEEKDDLMDTGSPIRIHLEKKGRGGKTVTILKGLHGSEEKIKELHTSIKSHCGTGGTIKDNEIIIQGDQRDKILQFLLKKGFKDVKKSGG